MLNGKCQLLRQPVESIVIPRVGKSAVMSHIKRKVNISFLDANGLLVSPMSKPNFIHYVWVLVG